MTCETPELLASETALLERGAVAVDAVETSHRCNYGLRNHKQSCTLEGGGHKNTTDQLQPTSFHLKEHKTASNNKYNNTVQDLD